jgi:hypothetical protein
MDVNGIVFVQTRFMVSELLHTDIKLFYFCSCIYQGKLFYRKPFTHRREKFADDHNFLHGFMVECQLPVYSHRINGRSKNKIVGNRIQWFAQTFVTAEISDRDEPGAFFIYPLHISDYRLPVVRPFQCRRGHLHRCRCR